MKPKEGAHKEKREEEKKEGKLVKKGEDGRGRIYARRRKPSNRDKRKTEE